MTDGEIIATTYRSTRYDSTAADAITLADLREKSVPPPPTVPSRTETQLARIVAKQLRRDVTTAGNAVLELSARHPYDPVGLMDFYEPGRWDSTSDTVYMSAIVTGSSPGDWTGTVGYLQFTALVEADYLIVVNFSGFQTTMRLNGPWGTNTAHTASTSEAGTVTALWSGSADSTLSFTINCVTDSGFAGIGYLQSVQVYRLS